MSYFLLDTHTFIWLGDFQERPYPLPSVKFRILLLPCGYNDCWKSPKEVR